MMEYFPTANKDIRYDTLAIVIKKSVNWAKDVGCVCFESGASTVLNSHIYLYPNCRTSEIINILNDNFNTVLSKYMKDNNKDTLITSCAYDDVKTKGLLDSFGFNSTAHWIGVINY